MLKTNTMNLLEKALTGSSLRHSAIGNNIANANTPGYKKIEVSFQHVLENTLEPRQTLKTTSKKHLPMANEELQPFIQENRETTLRNDGNNVDIDMELSALAENNLYFNSLTQLLSSQLALLRQSISEGRR
ncbi:MAG: flagellar basal body rod protein FlgB [Bacillota bacterium]